MVHLGNLSNELSSAPGPTFLFADLIAGKNQPGAGAAPAALTLAASPCPTQDVSEPKRGTASSGQAPGSCCGMVVAPAPRRGRAVAGRR